MRIILLGNFPTCLPLLQTLRDKNHLLGICSERHQGQSESILKQNNIFQESPTFLLTAENITTQFEDWLRGLKPDLVLVCRLSLKVPEKLLSIPHFGFLNIHFGELPQNRGADPLFWSIKNGEKSTAITIHQMDKNWDSGAILLTNKTPIIPGETWGMLNSKMGYLLPDLAQKVLNKLNSGSVFKNQTKENILYNHRPSEKDRSIHWESQTADEIEQLVNACNPKYGGATTYYQGAPIKIWEVAPVDGQLPVLGKTAGEIIHAHPQEGIYVCCKYGKIIRINTIGSDAGILSGGKYALLGMRIGQLFTTLPKVSQQLERA